MTTASVTVTAGAATRRVTLDTCLGSAQEEAAAAAANAWIKSLRHARVDGLPLRRRFTHRGDSLWWFAELYLHKQQVVLTIFRTIAALDALLARDAPSAIAMPDGDPLTRRIAAQFAAARGVRFAGAVPRPRALAHLVVQDARSIWHHGTAVGSRLRRPVARAAHGRAMVLAFVHRAFWQADTDGGRAEQYIGPTLRALEARLPGNALQYVSVGPAENFRVRRWWHPVVADPRADHAAAVESFASIESLEPSTRLWRDRHTLRQALWCSDDLRALAHIEGCDCWSIIRQELAGVALLQWPWSARAMDEAGAAIDALGPSAALTYAEAGGWGRAIVLECRRRGIPTAGLQHGFIYRHWLNYLHEPDEMLADPDHLADAGFPRPSLTLLFDAYAARHLADAGHFPATALRVTGSPRLDDLVGVTARLTPAEIASARTAAGAAASDALVLVTTKCKEAQRSLPAFLRAANDLPGVHIAIKAHPAETAAVYEPMTRGLAHVTVLPASMPLAPLLAASRVVVTVNSTVALDAAVLGVPALVVGLPNNLTPFVDAGLMAGDAAADPAVLLHRILYDERFRQGLDAARRTFLARYRMHSDGQAAERGAAAVLELVEGTADPSSQE